jgi:tRNA dimethylallyltransferase
VTDDDPFAGWTLRALVGPTASGKSALGLAVAERAGAEILSLDSMLVYRGLDVGTAKPGPAERARVRHHLIDLVEPAERYDVQRYLQDAREAVRELRARGARGFFVGGTGFYLAALLRGLFEGPPVDAARRARGEERARRAGTEALHAELARVDPASARRIHARDTKRLVRALEVFEQTGRALSTWQREWGWHGAARPAQPARIVGIDVASAELDRRIAARAEAMLAAGWADEATRVRAGPGFGASARQALGYREVLALADGRIERAECLAQIALRTRQFARRQRTWLRKLPVARWLPPDADPADVLAAFGWS